MGKKGIAIIFSFIIIVVLTVLGSAILLRSISESNLARRNLENKQAFWLAEAGISEALTQLKTNYNLSSVGPANLGPGRYAVTIAPSGTKRIVSSTGYVPATGEARATRSLQAVVTQVTISDPFYSHAIYASGEVEISGSAYTVTNNQPSPDNKAIIYGGEYQVNHPEGISGTVTYDSSISPLPMLDFQNLLNTSTSQGNVYNATRLNNVKKGTDSFPSSFWYSPGVPNVVYVQSDLELNGNIGQIGGFFVVVGNVITNPSATAEAEINGNGQIDGCIYTRGEFEINGGGGNLNINGGVWAGHEAELKGTASITYNATYMDALATLMGGAQTTTQVYSWGETQSPY